MNTPPNMGFWLVLADVALFLAAVTAIAYGWREHRHRPLAAFLATIWMADGVRRGLAELVLTAPGPYEGPARLAFHADEALWLLWPTGLALVAVLSLAPRGAWIADGRRILGAGALIVGGYLGAVAMAVLRYPVLRGETLREVYLVAELAGVAVAIACVVAWARRREPVTPTVIVVFALVGAELVSLFTRPWTGGLLESWSYVWPVHAVVYAAIAAVQGGALWSTKRR